MSELNPNPSLVVSDLPLLLPELSPTGIRSIRHWWKVHGLLQPTLRGGQRVLVSTQLGQLTLAKAFPALDQAADAVQPGQTTSSGFLLILRVAPAGDRGFRALRASLRQSQAILIGRGSYALAHEPSLALKQVLLARYAANVWLIKVGEWQIGSYRDVLLAQPSLMDGLESYSGISSELAVLLAKVDSQKGLIYSTKNQWYSLYNRFYAVFCENRGIIGQFLPLEQQPVQLLKLFQSVLTA